MMAPDIALLAARHLSPALQGGVEGWTRRLAARLAARNPVGALRRQAAACAAPVEESHNYV